jgi:hypothetical protein
MIKMFWAKKGNCYLRKKKNYRTKNYWNNEIKKYIRMAKEYIIA